MKIVTWNCNGAFRKKYLHLEEFHADIIIVQECENPEIVRDTAFRAWAKKYFWIGENQNKGLGIFGTERVLIKKLNWRNKGLKYFITCLVNNNFILLGTWCHSAELQTFSYIGQLWKYLQNHRKKLKNSVIAGDFNSNTIWDKPRRGWNHSDVVKELAALNMESFYHTYFKEEQGNESRPTFFLQKNKIKSYHIDYIFAGREFTASVNTVSVGQPEKWLAHSDHMPVYCEFVVDE